MSENSRLPIFERWAERYDQSVQTDKGVFASHDLVLAEVVCAAQAKAGMRILELGIGTGNLAHQRPPAYFICREHSCGCFSRLPVL